MKRSVIIITLILFILLIPTQLFAKKPVVEATGNITLAAGIDLSFADGAGRFYVAPEILVGEVTDPYEITDPDEFAILQQLVDDRDAGLPLYAFNSKYKKITELKVDIKKLDSSLVPDSYQAYSDVWGIGENEIYFTDYVYLTIPYTDPGNEETEEELKVYKYKESSDTWVAMETLEQDTEDNTISVSTMDTAPMMMVATAPVMMMLAASTPDPNLDYRFDEDRFYEPNSNEIVDTVSGALILRNTDVVYESGPLTVKLDRLFNSYNYYSDTSHAMYQKTPGWHMDLPYTPNQWYFTTPEGYEYTWDTWLGIGGLLQDLTTAPIQLYKPQAGLIDDKLGYVSSYTSSGAEPRGWFTLAIELKREKIVIESDLKVWYWLWFKNIDNKGTRAIMPDGTIYHFDEGTGSKKVSRISDASETYWVDFYYNGSQIDYLIDNYGRKIDYTRTTNGNVTTETINKIEADGTTTTPLIKYVDSYDDTNNERTITKYDYVDGTDTTALKTIMHIEDDPVEVPVTEGGYNNYRDITITYPTGGESTYTFRDIFSGYSGGGGGYIYFGFPRVETHHIEDNALGTDLYKFYEYYNISDYNLATYRVLGRVYSNTYSATDTYRANIIHSDDLTSPFYKKGIEYQYVSGENQGPKRIRHYAPDYIDYINENGDSYTALKGSDDYLELTNISSYQTLQQYKLEKYDFEHISDDYNEPEKYLIFYTSTLEPTNNTAVFCQEYQYDVLGQVIAEKDSLGNVTEYNYVREASLFNDNDPILSSHSLSSNDPYTSSSDYGSSTYGGLSASGAFWRFGLGKVRRITEYEDYANDTTKVNEKFYLFRSNYGLIEEEQERYLEYSGTSVSNVRSTGIFYGIDLTYNRIVSNYMAPDTGIAETYDKQRYTFGTSGYSAGQITMVKDMSTYTSPENTTIAANTKQYYEFDKLGNIIKTYQVYYDGSTTTTGAAIYYTYDTQGRVIEIRHDPVTLTSFPGTKSGASIYKTIDYANATSNTNASVTITNAVGEILYNEYDGLGRLILEEQYIPTNGAGSITTTISNSILINKIEYGYHPLNYSTPSVTKRYGDANTVVQTTEYLFDCEGRVLKTYINGEFHSETKINDGSRLERTFIMVEDDTSSDEVASVGLKIIKDYDVNGNLIYLRRKETTAITTTISYPTLEYVEYAYDGFDHLITEKRQVGEDQSSNPIYYQIDYEYNSRGELLNTTFPDATSEVATYDLFGRFETGKDREGNVVTNEYNGFHQLLKATIDSDPVASGFDESIRTYYGLYGSVVQQNQRNGSNAIIQDAVMNYDVLGRLIETSLRFGNTIVVPASNDTYIQNYTYDNIGNPTSMTLKKESTTLETISYTPKYAYNHTGYSAPDDIDYSVWNSGVDISGQFSVDVGHYWWGGRSHIDYDFNTTNTIIGYDSIDTKLLVPTEILDFAAVNPIYNLTYTYDDIGNILSLYDNGTSESFSYDGLGRITSETRSGTTYNYSYDMLGNRLNFQTGTPTSATYIYDSTERMQLNSMIDAFNPSTSFSYNDNGSMTQKNDGSTTWTYSYNASGKMVSASDGTNTSTYTYGPNGLRFKKVEGGKTTYYLYSGNDILMEEVFDGINTANSGTPESRIIYINFEGNTLGAIKTDNQSNKTVETYIIDHLGSRKKVLNSSGNEITSRSISYYPFGEMKLGNQDDYKFTNKEMDDTGLNYFNARYYDPTIGRFISIDPIKDGLNWYMYCLNNPLVFTDPSGLKEAVTASYQDEKDLEQYLKEDVHGSMHWGKKDDATDEDLKNMKIAAFQVKISDTHASDNIYEAENNSIISLFIVSSIEGRNVVRLNNKGKISGRYYSVKVYLDPTIREDLPDGTPRYYGATISHEVDHVADAITGRLSSNEEIREKDAGYSENTFRAAVSNIQRQNYGKKGESWLMPQVIP